MSQGKRRTPEQIINCLREAEVLFSQGLIPKHFDRDSFVCFDVEQSLNQLR
jgi:hypothetical protein